MSTRSTTFHARVIQRILLCCALVGLGVALTACATTDDDRTADPVPEALVEPAADPAVAPTLAPASSVELGALQPSVTSVYECSLNGLWYATRAICTAHCGGGVCFLCGVNCQN
jgi:hypothetical protein